MRLALPVALAVALLACGPAPATFSDADRQAIEGLLSAQADAWNAGDLDAFMAGYENSDALVFTSGAKIQRGWDNTRARFEERYGSGDKSGMGKLEFEILEVRPLGAQGAVILGKWMLTDTPQAGGGVFSLAALKTAKGWKIVHDHTSANPTE
jgi:ketosteroid isomerase-like protein